MGEKVSELDAVTEVTGDDILYLIQDGDSKKATVDQVLAVAPPAYKPQIVTTRNNLLNALRQGTDDARNDIRVQNRQKYYVGSQAVSQLQVGQCGFYLKNDSTAEHVLPNDYTWEAAIESITPSTYQQAFAQGIKLPVIQGSAGIPLVLSDPIGLDLAAGSSFWLRQSILVSTSSQYIPGSTHLAGATDTGWISPAATSQVPGTGDMTLPASGAGFGGPQAIILGIPAAPMASVCFVGDSIADGTYDVADATGNYGFFARGLSSVNGYPVPYISQTIGGDQFAVNTYAYAPRKRVFWPYVTHLVISLGTNDIFSNNASLSTLQTYVTDMLTAAKRTIGPYGKPLQTAVVTLFPRTNSTDSWATAANQTTQTHMDVGGVRTTYNAWLASIAGGDLLDAVIDVNTYVEDPSNPGKWLTNGTANYPTPDGTHPASALHILAAQAVHNWALTITP